MALQKLDTKRYQEMTRAELQAKAAEIEQLRERPKAAVNTPSRAWTFVKTLGLAAVGAVIGHWLGGKLDGTKLAESNKLVGWVAKNKKLVGMATVTAAGVSNMRSNRRSEVQDKADIELAKIHAVLDERERAQQQPQITAQDMAALNHGLQSGQAVGQHSERALAARGGQQVGV